jgi:predicted O-methyltransferase YrrM
VPVPRRPWRADRERINLATHNLLRRSLRRVGLDAVRADFNSPVPDSRTLPPAVWEQPAAMPGLELDLDAQQQFIETALQPFIDEFTPPLSDDGTGGFYLHNRWYGALDAHLLYAMLRHHRPKRLVEVGSGYSTLVARAALEANTASGVRAEHHVIDPYPSPLLTAGRRQAITLREESAATVDDATFQGLEPGDVLFVDSSHVVRPGGEVVRLVLEILPTLAPGVVVHFHDVFRPFEYPRILYDRFNVHWQEQYLVQALLAENPHFTVSVAAHALWRLRREWTRQRFPGLVDEAEPSAFWFTRRSE